MVGGAAKWRQTKVVPFQSGAEGGANFVTYGLLARWASPINHMPGVPE